VYNIADDKAMGMADFIKQLASAASAPRPKTIPGWIVRIMAPVIAALGSENLPLDNSKARRELGWVPLYPTVARGLTEIRGLLAAA
jgi:nucleoside-diphosphate-sugar epimerase